MINKAINSVKNNNTTPILLLGYGNPGRQDDGLGPSLIDCLERDVPAGVSLDADYQLTVENAWDIAQHKIVILIDAAMKGQAPFFFKALSAEASLSFSTHSISPGAVLHLAQSLFKAKTKVYLLGIRGYDFDEIAEGLSEQALNNLSQAEIFIRQRIANLDFTPLA